MSNVIDKIDVIIHNLRNGELVTHDCLNRIFMDIITDNTANCTSINFAIRAVKRVQELLSEYETITGDSFGISSTELEKAYINSMISDLQMVIQYCQFVEWGIA